MQSDAGENTDPVQMVLSEWAEVYCRKHGMRHRQPAYAARRFERLMGPLRTADITTEILGQYREQATADGLSNATIESGLKYICKMVREATGTHLDRGDKLTVKGPQAPREATLLSELIEAAEKYVVVKDNASRNVVTNCGRWQRLMGVTPVVDISEEHFTHFRKIATTHGLSEDTIRKTLISVKSVCKFVTGVDFHELQVQRQRAAEPALVKLAESYVTDGGLVRQQLVSNAKRFCRNMGDIDASEIRTEHLVDFRKAMVASGLSYTTIEKTITDVMTLVRHATNMLPWSGKRLRRRRPTPKPVPMETIERVFEIAPLWLRQWLVLTFWTAGRLSDSMRLQLAIAAGTAELHESLTFQASKTGRDHTYPIPEWLRGWLKPCDVPFQAVNAHSCRVVRHHLTLCAMHSGCGSFLPKQLRQRGIVQWMRANGAAGAIVHGKSLGVCDHYVPAIEILEEAAPKVVVPAVFKTSDLLGVKPISDERPSFDVLGMFSRLDDQQQALVLQTMQMLLGKA